MSGVGYGGGRWQGNTFQNNTAVNRVDTNVIKTTYVNREAVRSPSGSQASFNGKGGVQAQPTAAEKAAAKGPRVAPVSTQRSTVEAAKKDPALQAKANNGKPSAEAVSAVQNKQNNNAVAKPSANAAANSKKGTQAANREQAQNAKPTAAQERTAQHEKTAQHAKAENASQAEKKASARQHAAKAEHNTASRAAAQTRHVQQPTHHAAPKSAQMNSHTAISRAGSGASAAKGQPPSLTPLATRRRKRSRRGTKTIRLAGPESLTPNSEARGRNPPRLFCLCCPTL